MPKLTFDISMSLDGYVAGPNQTLKEPLGRGGEQLHEWVVALAAWREQHDKPGGEVNASTEVVEEGLQARGATIMGRRMFSGGEGPWEEDPNPDAWWGDDPPFHHPVFVLTHHPREPMEKEGGTTFTFVTDGIESALEQARAAAGEKDVAIGGGGETVQQYLRAGLVDEFHVSVVPVFLGPGGVRLFDDLPPDLRLELDRVVDAPGVTHLRYRVLKS
jgi:dihydrofolate reductase